MKWSLILIHNWLPSTKPKRTHLKPISGQGLKKRIDNESQNSRQRDEIS